MCVGGGGGGAGDGVGGVANLVEILSVRILKTRSKHSYIFGLQASKHKIFHISRYWFGCAKEQLRFSCGYTLRSPKTVRTERKVCIVCK